MGLEGLERIVLDQKEKEKQDISRVVESFMIY